MLHPNVLLLTRPTIDIGLIRLKVLAFIEMEFPVVFVWFVYKKQGFCVMILVY